MTTENDVICYFVLRAHPLIETIKKYWEHNRKPRMIPEKGLYQVDPSLLESCIRGRAWTYARRVDFSAPNVTEQIDVLFAKFIVCIGYYRSWGSVPRKAKNPYRPDVDLDWAYNKTKLPAIPDVDEPDRLNKAVEYVTRISKLWKMSNRERKGIEAYLGMVQAGISYKIVKNNLNVISKKWMDKVKGQLRVFYMQNYSKLVFDTVGEPSLVNSTA
jgi:hypothetical protein